MFIANELSWNMLNDAFIGAMLADLEDFDFDDADLDESLRCHDVMFSMQ